MKTEGNHPSQPTGDQRDMQPEFGLTKREYFAAMAMQGLLASVLLSSIPVEVRIQMAVESADALIEALNK